jgi:hypothetical protein
VKVNEPKQQTQRQKAQLKGGVRTKKIGEAKEGQSRIYGTAE